MTDAPVCQACAESAVRLSHLFRAGCKGCAARALARGQHYHRVRKNGMLDRAYRNALDFFGITHEQVKAAAKADYESRAPEKSC